MHDRGIPSPLKRLALTLAVAFGVIGFSAVGLTACGGDDSSRRRVETQWEQDQRLPMLAEHWWWTPVERACTEDQNCPTGERCQRVSLATCPNCPRGEDAQICVPRDGSREATRRRCLEAGAHTDLCY